MDHSGAGAFARYAAFVGIPYVAPLPRGRLANGAWLGETLVADIIESLSVRAGEVLTPDVIEERARNIAAALLGKYEIKERT